MGAKKKYCFVPLYMLLLTFLPVIFIALLSNVSLAMTSEEVTEFLNSAKEQMQEIEGSSFVENWFNKSYSYTNLFTNFECISIGRANTYYYLTGFNLHDNTVKPYYNTAQFVIYNNSNSNYSYLQYGLGSTVWGNNSYNNQAHTNATLSISNIVTNFTLYDSINGDTEYTGNNYVNTENIVSSSITLVSSSHPKYQFTTKNQCNVYLTGDYELWQFDFKLQQQYYDDELQEFRWQDIVTDGYYIDYDDGQGNIYSNPYYVYFPYLNQLPAYYNNYQYRYVATYLEQNAFSVWSEPFLVLSSVVNSEATGTVDSNGNIDITVDNGNEVDNIKDFLSSPPDFDSAFTDDDADALVNNINVVNNPYQNFITSFLDGLTSAMVDDASDLSFKVHTWGEERTLTPSQFAPAYGSEIRTFLTIISTTVWCIVIVKWVTLILEGLSFAEISKTLPQVEKYYSDLF